MLKATATSLPLFLITLVQRDEDGQIPGQAALCCGQCPQRYTSQGRSRGDKVGTTSHGCPLGTPHIAGTMLFLPVSSQHLTSKLGALAPPVQLVFSLAGLNPELVPYNLGTAHPPPQKALALPLFFAHSATSW